MAKDVVSTDVSYRVGCSECGETLVVSQKKMDAGKPFKVTCECGEKNTVAPKTIKKQIAAGGLKAIKGELGKIARARGLKFR